MGNSGNILRSMLCFLSMDLPKPFVLQRADEDFFVYHRLFYLVLGWAGLVELLCGEFLDTVRPLIVTCVLLLLWYYSMRVLRKFGNGNMVSIYALFPVALEWGLICRLSYSIASTLTLIFVLWLFLGYIRIKNKKTSVWVAFILLPIIYSMVGSRLFVFSLMVIFYEGAKETVVVLAFSFVIELFISVVHASFLWIEHWGGL